MTPEQVEQLRWRADLGPVPWEDAWPLIEEVAKIAGGDHEVSLRLGYARNWVAVKKKRHQEGARLAVRPSTLVRLLDMLDDPQTAEPRQVFASRGEPEVVRADEVAETVRDWTLRWMSDRPKERQTTFFGPVDFLSQESGVSTRQIARIVSGELRYVGMGQADALMIAMGRHLSELRVIPNPNWSRESWQDYMHSRGC